MSTLKRSFIFRPQNQVLFDERQRLLGYFSLGKSATLSRSMKTLMLSLKRLSSNADCRTPPTAHNASAPRTGLHPPGGGRPSAVTVLRNSMSPGVAFIPQNGSGPGQAQEARRSSHIDRH